MTISRRHILGASSSAALMAVAPGLKISMAHAQAAPSTRDLLVVLYLRGGSDSLQVIAPSGDANYISNRPTIRVRSDGTTPGIGLGTIDKVDMYFHPLATDLKGLYDQGKLAVVVAAGLNQDSRSHFECQERMEFGASKTETLKHNDGWLARHINLLGSTRASLATVAVSADNPISLLGHSGAVAIPNASAFNVSGGAGNISIIRKLNGGSTAYERTATQTLSAVEAVQTALGKLGADSTNYGYTGGGLTTSLRSLASMVRMNIGVEVAHVNMNGWDMHDGLVGEMNARMPDLSRNLSAFWRELGTAQQARTTVVTMTEFGRRIRENASQGTDHGLASFMFVLGGSVNGGRIYGSWPGLAANQLVNGDLQVTTDYRRVIGELLAKRQGQTRVSQVFPTVAYNPMGIVTGSDAGVT